MATNVGEQFVFVGTYNRDEAKDVPNAEGIFVYRLDATNGALTPVHAVAGIANPSFLALHPTRPLLYAVSEVPESDGRPGGVVRAFAIDPATGALAALNQQSSGGSGPCHLSVEASGRYVVVANYGSGSVGMLPINADGGLAPASDVVQHVGTSVNPDRQKGPHAHFVAPDPANRFAMAVDLGLDKILIYRLDLERGKLPANDPPSASVDPGAGPRHLDFHPSGRFAYVINELNSTMTAFAYDQARGAFATIQVIKTISDDFTAENWCADVHVAPSGRFLYGSNRGHDSIVIYAIDQTSGKLTLVGNESTQGRWPRNFGIDLTGNLMLAGNGGSGSIVAFRIDQSTGRLTPTGQVTQVRAPVCIKFRAR